MGFKLGSKPNQINTTKRDVSLLKYVVLHHTATRTGLTVDEMETSMRNTRIGKRGASVIPTHYIVAWDGSVKRINDWDVNVYSIGYDKYNTEEQVREGNRYGIHIEIIGDFNQHDPSEAQYKAVRKLIEDIEDRRVKEGIQQPLLLKSHGDFQSKNCPGKNFDLTKVVLVTGHSSDEPELDGMTYLGEWDISRYYSPMRGQDSYYPHRPSNEEEYLDDKKMNCGLHSNCLVTANGHKLIQADAYKVVACPQSIDLGTKLFIKGIGEVICHDRGSAIAGTKLDLRAGIGQAGLDKILTHKIQDKYSVYIIN